MDKLNKLSDELEAMKDLYINMVKNATKKYEIDYDDEDTESQEEKEKNQK